jgi:hypothetical protein
MRRFRLRNTIESRFTFASSANTCRISSGSMASTLSAVRRSSLTSMRCRSESKVSDLSTVLPRVVTPPFDSASSVPAVQFKRHVSGHGEQETRRLVPRPKLADGVAPAIEKYAALEPLLFQLVSESLSAVRMAWTAIAAMTPVRKSPETPIPIASARASACRGTMSP